MPYNRLEGELIRQGNRVREGIEGIDCLSPSNPNALVIVEPRRLDVLFPVIYNALWQTRGHGFNLYIFCGIDNHQWIRDNLALDRYRLVVLGTDNLTIQQYNNLLMSIDFWSRIHEENVLIFQSDVMFIRGLNPVFLQYDYIGPSYYDPKDVVPGFGGIQGGVSLRKKSAMTECIRKISFDDIRRFRQERGCDPEVGKRNEDVFFTHACYMLAKKLPDASMRSLFGIEAEFNASAFAIHGYNKPYFTEEQVDSLIETSNSHCPS